MAITIDGDSGVSGVNGSATTPALQGTDSNTGIVFGTDEVQIATGGSTRATVDSSGNFGIGTTSPSEKLHVAGSLLVDGGSAGKIDVGDVTSNYGRIYADSTGTFIGSVTNNPLIFRTNNTERMQLTSGGVLGIGTTSPGSAQACTMYRNAAGHFVLNLLNDHASGYGLSIGSDSSNLAYFYSSVARTAVVGTISKTASTTSYNTSSDYRLKENVVDLDGAIDRVKQLLPKRFNFIVDGETTVDGFLAHEAATVVPEAVTGAHDEVDSDDNPVYQQIDQSKLVPLLTAALQEAISKIETLETKVTALEAA